MTPFLKEKDYTANPAGRLVTSWRRSISGTAAARDRWSRASRYIAQRM
jgi:hypothetical protein